MQTFNNLFATRVPVLDSESVTNSAHVISSRFVIFVNPIIRRSLFGYNTVTILCFADRASWYNSGQMTNLMNDYVI